MTTRTRVTVEPRACMADPQLDVMNFLNEAVMEFPAAVSFAPGRPREDLFDVRGHVQSLDEYVRRVAAIPHSGGADAVWQAMGQYGPTNGVCAEAIARHLRVDEGIDVDPRAIMVTVGAQEAMAILVAGLCEPERDVLLVSHPTYIGITGIARVLGVRVIPVESDDDGLDPERVERVIGALPAPARVRAVYDIPDFNNPLGTSMPVERRRALLEVCRRAGVLVIEDNPYGRYVYDHAPRPTIKSLDAEATCIYVGTFSKTLFPGLRVGYLVADQEVVSSGRTLAEELSRVKSLITVNTPPLLQAIVADALERHDGRLGPLIAEKVERCKRQRDAMLAALAAQLGDLVPTVSWNVPSGGFFLTVTLPFPFGVPELRECAKQFGVVVSPMTFFCVDGSRSNQIRLAFSYVGPDRIAAGVSRLAAFIRHRIAAGDAGAGA
jgi:(S)-3,5-dihydroxyphenylglycine transaminase